METTALRRVEQTGADPLRATEPSSVPTVRPPAAALPQLALYARRWLLLNRGGLRAAAIGAISLALFLLAWHLLTSYRVTFFVRFTNIPSPAAVYESLTRAMHDPKFFMHVMLSCRRILLGFSLAAVIAVPLGLVMGRFRLAHETLFPVMEVLRPIPAIAWVPMAIMLWPNNERASSSSPSSDPSFRSCSTPCTACRWSIRCWCAPRIALAPAKLDLSRGLLPCSLPHIFTGLTVGMGVAWVSLIAAEMISGQFGIGYFTWEAYSLVQYADIVLGMICIGVLGLGSSALIRGVGRLVMPWRSER